jgi:predicted transcriptional regulator of viral defense system
MKISSPELTILDLLRYPQAGGGLDNIATVLEDLGPKADPDKLSALCSAFERSVVQRTGYLLSKAGLTNHAEKVRAVLEQGRSVQWVELDPSLASDPELAPAIVERDKRWRVTVRHIPECDA